ncbi:MAG: ABC transporter permease, partial [Ferruginibacter sp.]|nr:ABC transporter permease [Cytophagales bacterium]
MFANYVKIALRTLLRHKSYAVINVLGLSLGITGGLLVFLLVKFHLSFDNYHAKADRTFRLVTDFHFDGVSHTPGVPNPMGKALRTDFPQLERVAMVKGTNKVLISVPNAAGSGAAKKFAEEEMVAFAEPQFFDVFDYRWVEGNPKTALSAP